MKDKFNAVLKELTLRHRELFETELALVMIKDKTLIQPVSVISNRIIKLFMEYSDKIKAIIVADPKIEEDLYNPNLYGCLNRIPNVNSFDHMQDVLERTTTDPTRALHVQMCFIYRIYDKLNLANDNYPSKFNELFSDRARKAAPFIQQTTYSVGICKNRFFNAKIKQHLSFIPPKEKFQVDQNSSFYETASALNMPTVCGPSGHTRSLALLAAVLGSFNAEQWQNYALIIASFLILAGAHSLHESLMISKIAGIQYEFGDYQSAFPQTNISPEIMTVLDNYQHLIRRA